MWTNISITDLFYILPDVFPGFQDILEAVVLVSVVADSREVIAVVGVVAVLELWSRSDRLTAVGLSKDAVGGGDEWGGLSGWLSVLLSDEE